MSVGRRTKRWVRLVAGAVGPFLLIASPFAVYFGTRTSVHADAPTWPSDVALIASTNGVLSDLGLLHMGPNPLTVRIPVDAKIDVQSVGQLPAIDAFRIVGAAALGRALQSLTGASVPYYLSIDGSILGSPAVPSASNLGPHRAEVLSRLSSVRTRTLVVAPGTRTGTGVDRVYTVDTAAMRFLLETGRVPPPPPPVRLRATVEVLNAGGATGDDRVVATFLRPLVGSVKVGPFAGTALDSTVVYYASNAKVGAAVVRLLGKSVAAPRKLPSTLHTTADVLILIGRDEAGVRRRRSPLQLSTPRPTPTQ